MEPLPVASVVLSAVVVGLGRLAAFILSIVGDCGEAAPGRPVW